LLTSRSAVQELGLYLIRPKTATERRHAERKNMLDSGKVERRAVAKFANS